MVGSDSILNSLSMNCIRMQDFLTPSYRRVNSDHRWWWTWIRRSSSYYLFTISIIQIVVWALAKLWEEVNNDHTWWTITNRRRRQVGSTCWWFSRSGRAVPWLGCVFGGPLAVGFRLFWRRCLLPRSCSKGFPGFPFARTRLAQRLSPWPRSCPANARKR